MPLPENFSPAEHLQDVILLTQNKIVRTEFNDVGDDNWAKDISTPRASLRLACTHEEADSIDMTILRLWLFFGILRKAQDFHPAIFGIPSTSYQETTRYYPQIHLYFEEKISEAETGYKPLRSQVSLRLMGETTDTLTSADVLVVANKIKTLFATTIPFHWKRGKELYSYVDQAKGYYFQILCFNETEAKKIIEQVLDIRNHTPTWKLLNKKQNSEPTTSYPTIPVTKTILGKPYKQPRRRPVGNVYFRHATLHIHGKPNPVVLVDPGKRYANSIVR